MHTFIVSLIYTKAHITNDLIVGMETYTRFEFGKSVIFNNNSNEFLNTYMILFYTFHCNSLGVFCSLFLQKSTQSCLLLEINLEGYVI